MKHLRLWILSCIAAYGLTAQAADDALFPDKIYFPSEQTVGRGQTALWTLPNIATQYQPRQPSQALRDAIAAQWDGRILDAQIVLDEARKAAQAGSAERAEIDLLNVSFLLQGDNPRKALELLPRYFDDARFSADAHAQAAMAHLALGQAEPALKQARLAHAAGRNAFLPNMAMSYALQGIGQLTEAHRQMHDFNQTNPESAMALAHEAELALMLDRPEAGRVHSIRAHELDATNPYVSSVYGLVLLIDGRGAEAANAFDAALRHDPHDAQALLGKGLAELQRGNAKAGLRLLEQAHDADPGNALILTYLGAAQQQAGQTDAALASWRAAQQADPKDPAPWQHQAQAELRANRLTEARESLRQAQARTGYRAVYRGANLLSEDEQLLRINLAEIQRRQGLDNLAFHTLADPVGEKNAASLRSQAALLQGQRFGESTRRSLLLQSQFDDRPGALPPVLDIYGFGGGQTGATVPQHGVVSGLNAQQASYHDYGSLFEQSTTLEADATAGSGNTAGAQVRAGLGGDTLGLSFALRQFQTDGHGPYQNLDNTVGHAIAQWRLQPSTQAFVSHQTFGSRHGETMFPGDPGNAAQPMVIKDQSQITRVGLRQALTEESELRLLLSEQQTGQTYDYIDAATGTVFFSTAGRNSAHGTELQYRADGAGHAVQWGVQETRARILIPDFFTDNTRISQQAYAAWQQALGAHWQLDAQLGWGSIDLADNNGGGNGTSLKRWLPKLGVVYAPDDDTHVRLAAWHGMDMSHVGDAALASATLAGFALDRPGDNNLNGTLVHAAALGADKRLAPAWLLEGQAQRRRTDSAVPGSTLLHWQLDEARLALHWQPTNHPWAATLAWDHERYQSPQGGTAIDSVENQRLNAQQLELRWFAGESWTAMLALSHNEVDGTMQTIWFSSLLPYRDSFDQADASVNWQFARSGALSAGVRNAADRRFQYTNLDPLAPRFSNGQLVYTSLKLAW
jgi:Flp pilus assembly protein TadD/outer membrane receptor protein involved in Fe transport